MKVLRGMYIVLVMMIGAPVLLTWAVCAVGWCVYIAIREKTNLVDMVVDMFKGPIKFAVYLYSNWIKYGNKYSQYPMDESAL